MAPPSRRVSAETWSEAELKQRLESENHPILLLFIQLAGFITLCFLWPFLSLGRRVSDWLMSHIIGRTYLYNVSWEDPRIDQRVFNLTDQDHVITIASAGCNVFDYLIENARVTAVDLNECQIALTELKAVACRHMEYEDFFRVFAQNDIPLLRRVYHSQLRPQMNMLSRNFWDKQLRKTTNFMFSGSSGAAAYFIFHVVFPLCGLGFLREAVIRGDSHAAIRAQCEQHIRKFGFICWFTDKFLSNFALPLIGVPQRQYDLGSHRTHNAATIVTRAFFKSDLVNDNYFYGGYLLGYYTKKCCPRYLTEDGFTKLKASLENGNLTLFHGTLAACCLHKLQNEKQLDHFTIASLLDHLDWMPPSMINEELTVLTQCMEAGKGRIFWRSFGDNDRVHSAPLAWLKPTIVDADDDRVGSYWSTWIATIPKQAVFFERVDHWNESRLTEKPSLIKDLQTSLRVVTFPVKKWFGWIKPSSQAAHLADNQHANSIEAFYESQADGYDSFRERMLHARSWLFDSIPIRSDRKMVWVDVGGGTARNLEFLPVEIIKAHFKKIIIADISPSLLNVAKQRVAAAGLSSIVECVTVDFCDWQSVQQRVAGPQTCDLVTMSYSLSMIPNKNAALVNATKLLLPDGEGCLGIADFFYRRNDTWEFNLLKMAYNEAVRLWFKQDNVHLLRASMLDCVNDSMKEVFQERFRARVPFVPFLKPVHGVTVYTTK
eukprot:m.46999 g.46999  ORF g.46999 m.46999 type:complete len:716 (-) comp17586_c0_seq2:67-2214(-)